MLKKGTIRSYSKKHWSLSHLRSFYARLFQHLEKEDVQFEGRYLEAASDLAFMIPMVEMAGEHAHFVKDILYLYNRSNPLNDHKVRAQKQQRMADYILNKTPYSPLKTL